jgi:hypothetical protein
MCNVVSVFTLKFYVSEQSNLLNLSNRYLTATSTHFIGLYAKLLLEKEA